MAALPVVLVQAAEALAVVEALVVKLKLMGVDKIEVKKERQNHHPLPPSWIIDIGEHLQSTIKKKLHVYVLRTLY